MNTTLWPKRLFTLDLSRGIASLGVVVWHWQHFAFDGFTLPEGFVRASQPWYPVLNMFYENGQKGVDYFFLLSGFIFFWLYRSAIADEKLGFRNFWVDRFSRLYPLHFATLLIVAALQALYISRNAAAFVYEFNNGYHFLLNLAFVPYIGLEKGWSFNGPLWSVSVETLLYLIFFMVARARQSRALPYLYISLVSFLLNLFNLHIAFRGMSLFFMGGFVFHATVAISTNLQKFRPLIYVITLFGWALTLFNYYVFNLADPIEASGALGHILLAAFPTYILFPSTVCALALFEINRGPGFVKSISWVGDITYSSYLLHFPLQLLFALAVSYEILNPDFYLHPISIIVFFFILVSLSYLTFVRFERPLQNIIRNKFKRPARA